MTPKEKADELVKKMYVLHTNSESKMVLYFAKQCALIAVDEILNVIDNFEMIYWENVKQEIEKL